MKTIHHSLLALASLGSLAVACSGSDDKVEIGNRDTAALGSKLTDYAGSWDGYAEAYEFPSGSDRLRITLDGSGNGTLEVGDVPALVMPSDPDVGFPPLAGGGFDAFYDTPSGAPGALPLTEGFRYTVVESTLEERRFRFRVEMGEIAGPKCEQQQSFSQGDTPESFGCSDGRNTNFDEANGQCLVHDETSGGWVPMDCTRYVRCLMQHCACDADHCFANPALGTAAFDATLENGGDDLVGTLAGGTPTTTRLTVRLTRAD